MPRDDLTEIICIVDRSGSMDVIKDDAIGGFNSFLEEQQKVPGDATLTLMLFDNEFLTVHDGLDLQQVPKLDRTTYVPRGGTALLDAIGQTLNAVEARIAGMDEDKRPGKVLVMILTDGEENSSREFDQGRIQKRIKDHEAEGWEFMYLKAGPDDFNQARGIGISAMRYANVGASAQGLRSAYGGTNAMAAAYRTGGSSAIKSMRLQDAVDAADLVSQVQDQAETTDNAYFTTTGDSETDNTSDNSAES